MIPVASSTTRGVRWAWGVLLGVALVTRLSSLPAVPLGPTEAVQALASLDATRGKGWPASTDSPLLLVANSLLFLVFGAGAGLSRALPALAGVGLVMLPWLWRKQIGEVGALCASAMLLFSPLSLFAARRVDAAAVGVLGAGLVVTLIFRKSALSPEMARTQDRPDSALLGAAVAFGLISGPAFYDVLLPGILAWLALGEWKPGWFRRLRWRTPLLIGIAVALLTSTALGFHWSGWAGISEVVADWVAGWRTATSTGMSSLRLLLLYEPLLLALALTALGWLVAHAADTDKDRALARSVGIWALLALLLLIVRPGVGPAGASAAVLPLALLGGWVVEALFADAARDRRRWVGLHALLAFVLWVPGLVALAQYTGGLAYADQVSLLFVGGFVLLALQGLLAFSFSPRLESRFLWQGAWLGLVCVLLLLQASFLFGLAYVRADSSAEPAVGTAASSDLRRLEAMLHEMAILQGVRSDALPVHVVDGDVELSSLMRWNLREFSELTLSASWPEVATAGGRTPLIITPEAAIPDAPPYAQGWQGMRFVALTTPDGVLPRCDETALPLCSEALRWYLYRETFSPPSCVGVILWRFGG